MAEKQQRDLFDVLDVVAKAMIPIVLGIATLLFNRRQEENVRNQFYAQLMGQREEADSTLRKDMFTSILNTFFEKTKSPPDPRQEVVNLEMLAYNFHDALDLTPLFKHVRQKLIDAKYEDGLPRVERLAGEVIIKQVDALREPDKRNLMESSVEVDKLHADVGGSSKSDDAPGFLKPIERGCVALTDRRGTRRRLIDVEIFQVNRPNRELEARLTVSKPILGDCPTGGSANEVKSETEQDTQFTVSLFDFPMVDNLRLENDDRLAVVLSRFLDTGAAEQHPQATIQVVYFPGSRASLKEKPYYDKIVEQLSDMR